SSLRSRARYTRPMPPAPSRPRIWYRSAMTLGGGSPRSGAPGCDDCVGVPASVAADPMSSFSGTSGRLRRERRGEQMLRELGDVALDAPVAIGGDEVAAGLRCNARDLECVISGRVACLPAHRGRPA